MNNANGSEIFVVVTDNMARVVTFFHLVDALREGAALQPIFGEFSVQTRAGRVLYTSHNDTLY